MKKSQLTRMEKQITDLRATLKSLSDGKDLDELIRIIRKPWFTSVAEAAFLHGLLESMNGQAKNMVALKRAILSAVQKVEVRGRPPPLPPN